ncbi:hypothetical protein DFH09DRAFT_987738 [Mycena vulgaris]|nr:hypothetical protein DFH09DRAFT_987738 [Mycena vulgaris]
MTRQQYFCKIADDAPSRQQHENGLRHKGNTERFIRSIYKSSEKKKKDDEEERREMARGEQAAQIAFAQDVGAGRAKLSSAPTPSTSAPPRKPPSKPSNPYTNYSTAKSLGYDDPDAERLAAEAERRRMQGVAGDWEMVTPSSSDATPAPSSSDSAVKRSVAALDEEESREFKLREKTIDSGLGQICDPGAISVKLKKMKEPGEPAQPLIAPLASPPASDATDKPKWGKLQWKKMGDAEEPVGAIDNMDVLPKTEEVGLMAQTDEPPNDTVDPTIKSEPVASPLPEVALGAIGFKKRKTQAGGARDRRQRI